MQAQVSIWDLLMILKKHHDALVHALDDTKISIDASPKDVIALLLPAFGNTVFFSDSDLPLEGKAHNRPLFIQLIMKAKKTFCVMVDDGLTINVYLLKLLHKFRIGVEELKASIMIIRAYDDSKKKVIETFKATVLVGEIEFVVEFMVLDIPPTLALLLGRP